MAGPRWQCVEVAGKRGRQLVQGSGPDVVLLGSPLAPGDCLLPTAHHLARFSRVRLFELPGSGRSERLATPWSRQEYADWAAAAIAWCGLDRPAVVGYSYSGLVAVTLAARYARACGALVVADAPGAGVPSSLARAARGAAADIALDFRLVAAMWHRVAGNIVKHTRNALRLVRESLDADVRGEAGQVRVPALVAWGARDYTVPLTGAKRYMACLPRARLYVSPRGTHTWPVSQAPEFAAAVGEFLSAQRAAAG